jgi:uracil-DNA glycosylase family 4
MSSDATLLAAEDRFRSMFRRIHANHASCSTDEWLHEPCREPDGEISDRPIVWSRRNGPWRHSEIVWVGAAPGNAGGMGSGNLGAHGTRIPFGGDIAGANLEVLMGSIGVDRNDTYIAASYNMLPGKGGGEPTPAELAAPVGHYASSVHIVRDTILAVCPRLIVALGNIAVRVVVAGARVLQSPKLPSLARLQAVGLARNRWQHWPGDLPPDPSFMEEWRTSCSASTPLPALLWLTHPSAQNMSPYARTDTLFYSRMVEARNALRSAAREHLQRVVPAERPHVPHTGIYALPEWRELVAPRHELLDTLWRSKGI